jgi:hypothetical protein
MKAQRRHELKTNTLAEAMAHLPQTGKRNLATAVTVILAGLLIGLLIRFRLNAGQERLSRAADNLAVAREDIDSIKELVIRMMSQPVDASLAQVPFSDALQRLDSVLADVGGSDPKLAAEALVARGDANWNMKEFDAATTQPSAGQTPSELLSGAEAAYQQVIIAYPQQHFSASTAHFGLAAIAEDRHDWDAARKQYQAILDDADAGAIFQDVARQMLKSVDDLEHPPVIAPATQAATQPAAAM